MMGLQPFQGHIGQGRIRPEKNALLDGWQCGMDTGCDRESDIGWRRLRQAALQKKREREKSRDSETGAMVLDAHDKDSALAGVG